MKASSWVVTVLCGLAAVAVAGAAETPAKSPATRLILLGTQGGPRVNAERAEPANLLVVKGKPYLIDAGNGVARQLSLVHFAPADIHEIFITHNHDDHNADWGTLMGLAWTNGNTKPITVYGPPGTQSMLKGYLQYFAPNVASHWAESSRVPAASTMRARDIGGPGLVYQDDNIRVTAVENCHYHFDEGTPGYGWQKSFAFRFQTPDRVIVFSGDTGQCGHVMSDFAKGADILVHEVIDLAAIEQTLHSTSQPDQFDRSAAEEIPRSARGATRESRLMNHMRTEHTTAEQVGQVARDAGVKLVVLSHLVNGGAAPNDAAYIAGVKTLYSGPVVVGKDLMEF
jgi:ribonuclease BN (tRNA processing enzyme)